MAVVAADKIIIPCTADSASIRGIHNLFRMIYGIEIFKHSKILDDDVFNTFISQAKTSGLTSPKVHMFVQNKSRVLYKNASAAFKAHIGEISRIANETKLNEQENFTENDKLVVNLKDGNTLASVINHTGLPLSKVQPKNYTIYGKKTQVNETQIDALKTDIDICVNLL